LEVSAVLKERIREVVEAMPDDVDVDALIERLYLLRRLEEAEEEIEAGRVLDHDIVEKRLASWLE
jgi:predicted transcriptional regulator